MPLQVSRLASARATSFFGSSFSSAAISFHCRPNAAAVRGPTSSMNSSEPTPKRPSASMCQTKRSGCRRSATGSCSAAAEARTGSTAGAAGAAGAGAAGRGSIAASGAPATAADSIFSCAFCARDASPGCAKVTTSTRSFSTSRRSAVTSTAVPPRCPVPRALPVSSAVAASVSMPNVDSVVAPASRASAAALA